MSEHTLHTPIVKRLERSRSEKILAGVCGGLGRYFDIAPAVFRLGFVVLTVLGGAGILVYLAAVLVMPKEGDEASIAEEILRKRRDHPVRLVALGLVAVAILSLLARADTWPSAGAAWFLVVVAGLVLLWSSTRRRGLFVALTSVVVLIAVAAAAAVVAAFAWFDVSLGDGVGRHTYTPTSVAAAERGYDLGIGRLDLDLTQLPAGAPASIQAHVGLGELRIVVPRNEDVFVAAHVKAGSIDSLGHHSDGRNARLETGNGSTLTVIANVGAGHVEVVRAS
ncbi:MAG TPA: PspC domain-containing protein [Gaiellaceae bacterium]|jgi:phage shock protein PspC (stress-responsive transcriptional regulator)|nr:PspC domain-containing protein [Gaiellaceae bacterium]